MDQTNAMQLVGKIWEQDVIHALGEYIKIPCKSPYFDSQWQQNGYLNKAAEFVQNWVKKQNIKGLKSEVITLEGRTPVLFIEIAGEGDDSVFFYGHLDKMPESEGWRSDLGPWKPVIEGDLLYGRGSVDDGYAAFAYIAAIKTLQEQNIPHARCLILLECCEESGSFDLPAYLDYLSDRLTNVTFLVCFDSGGKDFEHVWNTTSLRGNLVGTLTVEMLREATHSGPASGAIPSTFRILRQLLSRIEDENTGEILLPSFHVEIPEERLEQIKYVAKEMSRHRTEMFPLLPGCHLVSNKLEDILINTTWKPTLSVIGVEGMPPFASAGNVIRPLTAVFLTLRIPPMLDVNELAQELKEVLESDSPYGAKVNFNILNCSSGWNANTMEPWLRNAMDYSAKTYFGKPPAFNGIGGTIGIMELFDKYFPNAQYFVSGVEGPGSNAHGPNESLHIPSAKKITCVLAQLLKEHCNKNV